MNTRIVPIMMAWIVACGLIPPSVLSILKNWASIRLLKVSGVLLRVDVQKYSSRVRPPPFSLLRVFHLFLTMGGGEPCFEIHSLRKDSVFGSEG